MTYIRNAHFSGETNKIVWFSGTNEISIVSLFDLKMNEIKNFLPSMGPGQDAIALRAVMKDDGQTIVISFVVDNTFGIAYQNKQVREPNIYLLQDILPNCKTSCNLSQVHLRNGLWS